MTILKLPDTLEGVQMIWRLLVSRYTLKVGQVIELIQEDGWYLERTKGSHRQYKHPEKAGLVTVPGKLSDDLAPGTLNSILKQAGLK
ncbi:MAG: type II toxin-antitoxin system HicA family toxin [Leptolyngbyaceae cyanobacterium bins.59]|nr:type II toxin-antitoxin system HicA family toxin [Leptolyngbyaceae cyanobacterium bins.59]